MDIYSLSVARVKEMVTAAGELSDELLEAMAADARTGVQAIYKQYLKAREKEQVEKKRLREMYLFESSLVQPEQRYVAGIDEAGRGPLAGPVVAAAVVLPAGYLLEGLNDSKKMTPAKREALDAAIKNNATCWAVGMSTVAEIEEYNIHNASLLAMTRALQRLPLNPDLVLVDGRFTLPGVGVQQHPVVGGDGLCPSIAAASVVAKVTRDRLMDILHLLYPEYGFDRHRGYGTPYHLTAISLHGPCPAHRPSFLHLK